MHFTTLFVLKGETLDTINEQIIEDMFCRRYCYCCGEATPLYDYWCDWFQIGGRWSDILSAKNGIRGERNWTNEKEPLEKGKYSIVEIKDLTKPINKNQIYAIATKSRIYQEDNGWGGNNVEPDKFNKLLNDINEKKISGVVALIDCHD